MTKRAHSIGQLLIGLAAPSLWAAYLFSIYGVQTLACLRPAERPDGRLMVVLAVAATVATLAGLLVFAAWRWRDRNVVDEHGLAFLRTMSLELAALVALGVLWIALAAATIPLCGPLPG